MNFVAVEFIIPFRVYLPKQFLKVRLDNRIYNVMLEPMPPETIPNGLNSHGENLELSYDIFGYAGRTKFLIVLDYEITLDSENDKRLFVDKEQIFVEEAIKATNRVIEVYRDQDYNNLGQKSFHVIPIVRNDLKIIRLFPVDESYNQVEGLVIVRPVGLVGFGNAVTRNENIKNEIEKLLFEGTPIPVYRLFLDSARNSLWRGVFRLVPVEANTAFESFIPEIFKLIDSTCSDISEDSLFQKIIKLHDVINSKLSEKGIPLLQWFNYPKDGWKSLYEPSLLEWKIKCYELRNKVIHQGYNSVYVNEAKEAFDASLNVIGYIQSIIIKVLFEN